MVKSTVSFPEPQDVGPREWGHETLLALAPKKYTLKLITMHKGAKGGLQYHRRKDEAGIMTAGVMKINYVYEGELVSRLVRVGDVFHFPPGAVHQAEAISDCAYIEASTPHFDDRVHCEADFGLAREEGGLPSTTLEDVVLR